MKKIILNSDSDKNVFNRFWYVGLLVMIFSYSNTFGQSIFANTITGTNPNTSNPYTTGQTVSSYMTASGIGRGSGISGTNTNNRYNANSWSTGAIDLNDYFEFTLTPNSGYKIDFVDFEYTSQVSSGTANHAFRSSIDGFVSNIGTPTTAGTTISLSGASYQNVAAPITFRFYTFGVSAGSTTFSINDFKFSGTVSLTGITSAASGNWSSTTTWVGGVVPTSADNAIIANGHVVTMDSGTYATRNLGTTTTVHTGGILATNLDYINNGTTTINGSFQLNAGGWVSDVSGTNGLVYGSNGTLIFNTPAAYGANNGNYWPATNGPVHVTVKTGGLDLSLSRTVSGTFETAKGVQILGGAVLTLNGIARIITDGHFSQSPTYGSASTLIYNTGLDFNRGNEWTSATSGPGYPANVQISNPGTTTSLNMYASAAQCSGNLTIDAGTVLNPTPSTLTVLGNVTNNGTLSLNGDVKVGGNWTVGATATQSNNSKAVFFNGASGNQTITKTGGGIVYFDYLLVDKAAGSVVLSSSPATNVVLNTTAGAVLQILNSGSLDLNGQTLTMNGTDGNLLVNGGVRTITSGISGGTLAITGNKFVTGSGSLSIGANVTTVLTKGLDFGFDKTTINGILQINGGGYANNNAPKYGSSSTLIYNGVTGYGVGNEWTGNAATAGQGTPQNVTLTNSSVNMPIGDRSLAGTLTIATSSILDLNGTSGDLYIGGNWNKVGTFNANNRAVFFRGTTAQTITGATTFDYLTINNSAGVTLVNSVINNLTLDFTNGKLNLGTNDLTIGSGGTVLNSSSAKYIVTNSTGQLKRTVGASAILFPVGNTAYNPITFTNSGTSDVYGVRVVNAAPAGANPTKTISRQWITTEGVAGGSNLSVAAQYNSGEEGAGYIAAADNFIGHYNGTIYAQQVAATHSGVIPYTVTSSSNLTPSDLTTGTQYFALGRANGLMSVATKLVVTAITPTSPTQGVGFSVTVRSQDAYGSFASVIAGTSFTLTTNGNAGVIGGTVTGTLLAGTSTITVTGVTLATPGTGVTVTATRDSGDGLTAGQSASFIVLGVATKLAFGTAPPATGTAGVNLTTFTVRALRADNTLDNAYTGAITISKASGSGVLSGTLTANAVAGIATFNAAQFNLADTYTITASATGLTSVTSGNIVISPNPANGYFRSNVATGNWNAVGSWQSSPDGSTWALATVVPTDAANVVTILNGHTITVTSSVTTDQFIIASGGQLTVNSNTGTFNISNGTGTDVDIQSGGILQVTGTANYSSTIVFAASATMNVAGKITIGNGVATNGSGYDTFATTASSQVTWNNGAVYEWNSNGAFSASGLVFFPGVAASTVPIFRVTKIPAGNVGGGDSTIINGLLQLNAVTLNWGANGTKIFRNGVVAIGTASMIRNAGTGPWQIGDASTGTAEIGGASGILTLNNPTGITITSNCTATLTSNTTITSGGISHFGILNLGTNAFSGTGTFAARSASTLITSNTGGLVSAIAVGGTKTFEAGANYVFNASTTTPFPTGTFGNPASLTFNDAVVTSNRTSNITVSGKVDVKGTSTFTLNATTNDLTLGGLLTIDPNATFDNGGENQINNSGGTGSIVINGTFITRHTKGFAGSTTAIPSITPTLGSSSTVEYALAGDQIISPFNYINISFSGSGTKTTQSVINVDNDGLVKITGTAIVDATSNLADIGMNNTAFTMDGGRLILRTGSTQPNMRGTYTLTGGVVEYAGTSAKTIRNAAYQNIEVTGDNVGNSSGHITLNENGSFTVKTGGVFTINGNAIVGPTGSQTLTVDDGAVFKTGDPHGFYGSTSTSVRDDIETINLHMNSTVEYSGADQTITAINIDTTYGKLLVSGTGTKTLNTTDIEVANSLEVTASILSIETGKTLTVTNGVTTINDAISIADGGSLVQITDENVNAGKITVARTTKPMNRYDYTYWGSPVAGNTLHDLSPDTHVNRYYSYNPDAVAPTPTWTAITGGAATMTAGKGYIIRAPNNYATDSYTAFNGSFNGVPNNGTVSIGVSGSATIDKFNLLGNPYPSAISASAFVAANVGGSNDALHGTLYFWTHNSPFLSSPTYTYSTGDYASWNSTGSTATANTGVGNSTAPDGYIAAGQGFFVKGSADGGTAVFKNTMREKAHNMNFYRPTNTVQNTDNVNAETTETTTPEKHRVWLNLHGGTNGFSQALVGYITNATNEYDKLFDGQSFGGNLVTFYSINNAKDLVIQGRALPFVDTDEVPMGFKTTLTGTLTISIDHADGVLETQGIYLKDNELNVVHELSASPYTFAAVPGTFNSRFVLRYLPGEDLANPTFDEQISHVTIRKNEATLRVNSPYETIDEVLVYDIMGRLIFEKKDCNSNTFEASHIVNSDQTLIVKVRLSNGGVVSKKVF